MAQHPWLSTYAELGLDWAALPDVPALTLSGHVRKFARELPEREALVYLGAGITFAQLDRLADRLARVLLARGVERGDVLGLHMPNTPQYVVGFVAAARIGAVVTSISPLLRPPEIRHQANDASVPALLSFAPLFEAAVAPAIADAKVPSLRNVIVTGPVDLLPGAPLFSLEPRRIGEVEVEAFTAALGDGEVEPVPELGDYEEVGYLQYTGGTTGAPKGAQLSPRHLFVNGVQADVFYRLRPGKEIVASAFPLFHIGGAAVLFNAIRMASTFILVPDPRDLDRFCGEMKLRTPTVIAAVPALYQMLCVHPVFRALDFGSLTMAVSGAAPFSVSDIAKLEQLIGPGKFCEVYGMTETSPVQTLNPAERLKPGYVGVPVPETEVRIVDVETGTRTLPAGEPGEIIAAGPQVMHGYLNMPDATREALRELDGKTFMFTGDIGFMDEDGYVKLCDRSKDMLIVGGYKVFSVEVENKLLELDEIAACAVVGRADEDRPGNEVVQLYVQTAAGHPGDDALRERIVGFCRANMAAYKVPKQIFFREALPLTSVGKIDKKALRE